MFSDAFEGIKAGTARVLDPAALPRPPSAQCAHPAGKNSDRVVGSFIATTFAQPDHAAAKAQWRRVATRGGADARQARSCPCSGSHRGAIGSSPMANAEKDVPVCTTSRAGIAPSCTAHRLSSLKGEITRRTDVESFLNEGY